MTSANDALNKGEVVAKVVKRLWMTPVEWILQFNGARLAVVSNEKVKVRFHRTRGAIKRLGDKRPFKLDLRPMRSKMAGKLKLQ